MIAELIEMVFYLLVPAFRKRKKHEEEWYGVGLVPLPEHVTAQLGGMRAGKESVKFFLFQG